MNFPEKSGPYMQKKFTNTPNLYHFPYIDNSSLHKYFGIVCSAHNSAKSITLLCGNFCILFFC